MGSTLPPWETLKMVMQTTRPFIPMYTHLLLSALFPIYTGAHASLSRPSSAAKPTKKSRHQLSNDDDDEQEEDEVLQKMEGLSAKDAITLPLTAGCVLGGLYFLIKRYGADLINLILGVYFSAIGVVSVAKLVNDALLIVLDVLFPTFFVSRGLLWKADWGKRKMVQIDAKEKSQDNASTSKSAPSRFWSICAPFKTKYTTKLYIPTVIRFVGDLTLVHLVSLLLSLAVIAYTNLVAKPWPLTNLQGFAVSYSALQLLSPTSFPTGSLILAGLFAYDVWAVFFTPLMVTVATKLDQPIKLVFPRPDGKTFGMLGLGDIVLPGIMIALALRFDLHVYYLKKQKKTALAKDSSDNKVKKTSEKESDVEKAPFVSPTGALGSRFWTSSLPATSRPARLSAHEFPKPYFTAAMVGYIVGMLTTLGVMSVFQHAQPALLYLVPGVLSALWGTGLVRREARLMWEFSEADQMFGEEGKTNEEEKPDERGWMQWLKEELLGGGDETKKNEEEDGKEDEKKLDDTSIAKHEKGKGSDDGTLISFSIVRKSAFPARSSSLPQPAAESKTTSTSNDRKIATGATSASKSSTTVSSSQDDGESEEDAVIV